MRKSNSWNFLVCVPFFRAPHSKGSLHHCFFPLVFWTRARRISPKRRDCTNSRSRSFRDLSFLNKEESVPFVSFRFCDRIVDRDAFITVSFILRATSAIGGAAVETSALSILLGKYPDNVGMVSVRGILFVEFKLNFVMNTFFALP